MLQSAFCAPVERDISSAARGGGGRIPYRFAAWVGTEVTADQHAAKIFFNRARRGLNEGTCRNHGQLS